MLAAIIQAARSASTGKTFDALLIATVRGLLSPYPAGPLDHLIPTTTTLEVSPGNEYSLRITSFWMPTPNNSLPSMGQTIADIRDSNLGLKDWESFSPWYPPGERKVLWYPYRY